MGVTGLWSIVQPCARPIKIETLNRKRLAVDASIWIYQFLKAVRDKEGNALRNSHVVGFFRRICKLLYIGIKPVFVFDGGAPVLKRQTISGRKARREGRREDAVRTAGKLLAAQMARRAEEEERKNKEEMSRRDNEEEEEVPDNLVYVDELHMTPQERQRNRQFKKKDAYHLPNLDVSLAEMGAPNDPRIMSHEELEEYARQFHRGEDINIYDFSKIDFNGPFFQSLPASDRYNILNAARLRSRLRMGYSKDQLDTMFPNRMEFSKFQIERVKERNELTQRLMNINGMNGEDAMFGVDGIGRVAGEKGKEYVLVKNDGVEGGWALGVVSNKGEGDRNKPIDVEEFGTQAPKEEDKQESEDDGFEDVPIEGLNRLPKRAPGALSQEFDDDYDPDELAKRRRALYEERLEAAGSRKKITPRERDQDILISEPTDSLFLPEEILEDDLDTAENDDALFEDVVPAEYEDEELKKAIAMSLEHPEEDDNMTKTPPLVDSYNGPRIDQPLDFNQKNAKIGRSFAHMTNVRAHDAAPKAFRDESDDEDGPNLEAALAESRQTKYKPHNGPEIYGTKRLNHSRSSPQQPSPPERSPSVLQPASRSPLTTQGFDGPLPFESLNFGKSILGKKKPKVAKEESGGFIKNSTEEKKSTPKPLPSWFTSDVRAGKDAQRALEDRENENSKKVEVPELSYYQRLRRQETGEVIDLDAPQPDAGEIIEVESSDDGVENDVIIEGSRPIDPHVRMGDVADMMRAEPPKATAEAEGTNSTETIRENPSPPRSLFISEPQEKVYSGQDAQDGAQSPSDGHESEELIEWDESDHEEIQSKQAAETGPSIPVGGLIQTSVPTSGSHSRSTTQEFEDVGIAPSSIEPQIIPNHSEEDSNLIPQFPHEDSFDNVPVGEDDVYSDPEDEDLMRQLAVEAEEHARFASTLNARSVAENAQDYETELRQLRNQQKKDRRDADEVTHIMVTECQQLLKLFGLPYVTAPMEAEAQCAELVTLGLVDGIVTDDSDIFLFGGTKVYKNMFNQAKFVECYLSSDLEKEYSLDRQKLIRVAHLLGSDYTEGLLSVGPVTALEILSEFEDLERFAEWWNLVQLGQKMPAEEAGNAFRKKFRKMATKIILPNNFPDQRVDVAYLNPEVDSDSSLFEWGVPDLDALRSFLMATIGWTQERTDEVLVPVIKDMNRRETEGTQANITQFFSGGTGVGARQPVNGSTSAFAPRRKVEGKSKRMESALGKLHQQARSRTIGEEDEEANKSADARSTEAQEGIVNASTATNVDRRAKNVSTAKAKKRAAAEGSDVDLDDSEAYDASKKVSKRGKRVRNERSNPRRVVAPEET